MKHNYVTTALIAFFSTIRLFGVNNDLSTKTELVFQENKGQIFDQHYKARPDVLFSGTDGDLVFHLKKSGISYQLSKVLSWKSINTYGHTKSISQKQNQTNEQIIDQLSIYRIDINWLNANLNSTILKGEALSTYNNYYSESCPQGALEVKSFKNITYQNLYPGIDLKWYEKNGSLKYDYIVSPGANYKQIQLEFKGATSLSLNSKGQLLIQTPLGQLIEDAPLVKQDGKILTSNWLINGHVISFEINGIDSQKAFIIDPLVRLWATYYGGSGYDWVGTNYTDANGNLYMAGGTTSSNLQSIATTGAFQTNYGGSTNTFGDVFLVKFNSSGQRQWGTYFGGSGIDFAYCNVADANGNIYIAGGTTSTNTAVMTTAGAHQTTYYGGALNAGDALLAKFNSAGARIWSTYYGEVGNELVNSVACDLQGNVFIVGYTGSTSSTLIASPGAHQTTYGGGVDCFAAKFNSSGLRQWGTYYGSNGDEQSLNCITNSAGDLIMCGVTSSSIAIASPGSYQSTYAGGGAGIVLGIGDAFAVKFNANGVRQWGTYYGGTGDEGFYYAGIDANSNLYFAGASSTSTGTIIASVGAHQSIYGGGAEDALLVKFDPSGQRIWGTYYGGAGLEEYCCCFVDNITNAVYLSGMTTSGGTNIATSCVYQNTIGGSKDLFLSKFNLSGSRLWGTYYGGTGVEDWSALTVDATGAVYLGGETNSSSAANATVITSTGAHQTTYGGGTYDAFVVKFDGCLPTAPPALMDSTVCKGQTATLKSLQQCGINWYSDAALSNLVSSNSTFSTGVINHDTTFYYVDVSCGLPSIKSIAHVSVVAGPSVHITASNTLICKGETATLVPVGANYYSWVGSSSPYTLSVSPNVITVYTVTGTLFNGGCPGSAYISIGVSECIGLEKNNLDNLFVKIYPNPNNGSFTINSNKTTHLEISNELGQLIREDELNELNDFNTEIIDLPNGVYYLTINSMSKKTISKIIVLK